MRVLGVGEDAAERQGGAFGAPLGWFEFMQDGHG
jgi:hypothetical protein